MRRAGAQHDGDDRALTGRRLSREPDPAEALFEEMAVQTFQRWMRANERPILAGVDWDALKADALTLIEKEDV